MSSSGSTDQPKNGEIKALMAFGKSDQGIEEKGDKEKAEKMLTAMKDRGVDLNHVQQIINIKCKNRNVCEWMAGRISYVQTGVESPYSMRKRASRTASVAKGRKTRRHKKKSHKRKTHRRH